MPRGSDNPFPSVLVVEGATPASPAAGRQRVFISSVDNHLKRVNSGGTVVDIESAASGGITQLTGDVTAGPGFGSQAATIAADAVTTAKILNVNVTTAKIADANVTYAKIQDVSAASRLLGRGSASGAGDTEELSPGDGLVISGTTVNGRKIQEVFAEFGDSATGTTRIPADNSIPQQTEGDEYMTLAITPKLSTTKLKVTVVLFAAVNEVTWCSVALFRDATADAIGAGTHHTAVSGGGVNVSFSKTVDSVAAAATTFKVRAGPNDASGTRTLTFNGSAGTRLFGGVIVSSVKIEEYIPN